MVVFFYPETIRTIDMEMALGYPYEEVFHVQLLYMGKGERDDRCSRSFL